MGIGWDARSEAKSTLQGLGTMSLKKLVELYRNIALSNSL